MKVETIELIKDQHFIGHAPVIIIKGKKPKIFLDDNNEHVHFPTEKEARDY